MNKKRILITGASGFIGHHFVEDVLKNTDWDIVAMVRGKTIGDLHRLIDSKVSASDGNRVTVVACDLRFGINPTMDARIGHIDYVCHLAANSHVDRSITHPVEFFEDNVMGTVNLLEWARLRNAPFAGAEVSKNGNSWVAKHKFDSTGHPHGPIEKFLNFNTDEVFGPAPAGYDFKEDDRMRPSNPYSGAKMGQWAAGYSYWVTFKLPVISTHMMNVFGERQNSEKLVPKTIKKLLAGEPMTIHCKLENGAATEIGERHWLHARNAANATLFILQHGKPGEVYNIVGDDELNNLELAQKVANIMGKELTVEYQDFHSARPGHDRRYALDGSKLRNLGWVPPVSFEESLEKTVKWYMEHPEWLK